MVTVASDVAATSTEPHDEQKFTPIGFRWPQLWQNTSSTVVASILLVFPGLAGRYSSVGGQTPVCLGVQERIRCARVRRHDLADPPFSVGVLVHAFGCSAQFLVHGHDLARDRGIDL